MDLKQDWKAVRGFRCSGAVKVGGDWWSVTSGKSLDWGVMEVFRRFSPNVFVPKKKRRSVRSGVGGG